MKNCKDNRIAPHFAQQGEAGLHLPAVSPPIKLQYVPPPLAFVPHGEGANALLPVPVPRNNNYNSSGAMLRLRPSMFSPEVKTALLGNGENLFAGLRHAVRGAGLGLGVLRRARVFINGLEVERAQWATTYVFEGEYISVCVPLHGGGGGGGGKNPLTTILSVVVMAAAIAATWYIGGSGAAILGISPLGLGSLAGGIAGMAVMTGGMLLINAIAPASTPKLTGLAGGGDTEKAQKVWSIEGTKNQLRPYDPLPVVLGRVRWAPRLLAKPYSVLKGNDQYVRYLYIVGMGDVQCEHPRIGDTEFANFVGSSFIVHRNWQGESLTWFDKKPTDESLSIALTNAGGGVTRTTRRDTSKVFLAITFPEGLKYIDDKGNASPVYVSFNIYKRLTGTEAWTLASSPTFSGQTLTAQRCGVELNLESGQWDIQIQRTTQDFNSDATKTVTRGNSYWTLLQSWSDSKSIIYDGRPLTIIEAELKATDQLSGNVDEFNIIATSVAPVWHEDAKKWIDEPTNNPASLGLLISAGTCTAKAAKPEEIDYETYSYFYDWCKKMGWAYNGVITSRQQAGEALHNVLAAGRGSHVHNGKHSVIWDDPDAPVVELLTPANTWGFSENKEFLDEAVHGLRISFLDETQDWQEDERKVYADGYDETNATNMLEDEFDGVTNPDLLYKHGRLRLAEMRLRPATYSLSAEAESITIMRGSRVRCQHDVTLWGQASARVLAQIKDENNNVIGIRINQDIGMDAYKNYGIRVSSPDYADKYYSIKTVSDYVGNELFFTALITSEETAPDFDDLIAFGEASRETALLNVLSVMPGDNLTAEITLQDASPEIYQAIDGPIPEWNPNITYPTRYQKEKTPAPEVVSVKSNEDVLLLLPNGSIAPRIAVNFILPELPQNIVVEYVQIFYKLHNTDEPWTVGSSVSANSKIVYIDGVVEKSTYDLKIASISRAGVVSDYSPIVIETVVGRTTPPPSPDAIYLDGYNMRIIQNNRPLDVVGHEVWMVFDEADPFEYALKLSNPIVTDGIFNLTPYAGRARRIYVRTVDQLGLLSELVTVAINFGDVAPANIIFTISERQKNWEGIIEDGYVSNNNLFSNSNVKYWPEDDDKLYWPLEDSTTYWPSSGTGSEMRYTWRVTIPAQYSGCGVAVLPDFVTGSILKFELRHFYEDSYWPEDDNKPYWPADDTQLYWPSPLPSEWEVMPDNYISPGGETIEFRLTVNPSVAAQLYDIRTIFDVEDKSKDIPDIYIPVDGAHIPVPIKYFREITTVISQIQFMVGNAGVRTYTYKGTEIRDEEGYILEGPIIRAFDENKQPASAFIDVNVTGY